MASQPNHRMNRVIEERQRAYLEAMNIPVWELRHRPVQLQDSNNKTSSFEAPLQVTRSKPAPPADSTSVLPQAVAGDLPINGDEKASKLTAAVKAPGLNWAPAQVVLC